MVHKRTGVAGLAAAAALGLRLVVRVELLDVGNVDPAHGHTQS
jgi:hypothetical protein